MKGCEICDKPISPDNLGAIRGDYKNPTLYCDSPICLDELSGGSKRKIPKPQGTENDRQ